MRTTTITAMLVLALIWLAGFAEAAPMGTVFTYQGRLMDLDQPANGLYDFLFKIYNEPNGVGYTVPSNNVNDIDVIDGYFTVELDFSSNIFDGNAKWLGVSVRPGDSNDANDFVTLSPLQEVTPTPYALQTRGIFVDNAENVGIGTTNPTGKLHVDGGKAEDKTDGSNVVIKAQDGGDVGTIGGGRPGGDIILLPGEGGLGGMGVSGPSGKVGIGTENPSEKLDVDGNIDVSSNQIKHYYGFPRPNYDSGWVEIGMGETITLTHGLGGNVDNYVVDLQFKSHLHDPLVGINCHMYGGFPIGDHVGGGYYENLTEQTIQVKRKENDAYLDEFRIRIWVYN